MTTATTTRRTHGDVLARLEELIGLAADVAAAEDRLERAAQSVDWTEGGSCLLDAVPSELYDATRAEIENALHDAGGEGKRESCLSSLEGCQSIQDAIDVLKFAIERSDDAR